MERGKRHVAPPPFRAFVLGPCHGPDAASCTASLQGVISGKIDSSLLLGQFSFRVPARRTCSSEFVCVQHSRVAASTSALFSRLPRALTLFLQIDPSFDIFCDSNLAPPRLYHFDAYACVTLSLG